jgi:hypothetical protein
MRDRLKRSGGFRGFAVGSEDFPVTQDAFIHKTPHMGRRSASHANGMDHGVKQREQIGFIIFQVI